MGLVTRSRRGTCEYRDRFSNSSWDSRGSRRLATTNDRDHAAPLVRAAQGYRSGRLLGPGLWRRTTTWWVAPTVARWRSARRRRPGGAWRGGLQAEPTDDHVSFQDLTAFVDGTIADPDTRELVMGMSKSCGLRRRAAVAGRRRRRAAKSARPAPRAVATRARPGADRGGRRRAGSPLLRPRATVAPSLAPPQLTSSRGRRRINDGAKARRRLPRRPARSSPWPTVGGREPRRRRHSRHRARLRADRGYSSARARDRTADDRPSGRGSARRARHADERGAGTPSFELLAPCAAVDEDRRRCAGHRSRCHQLSRRDL
jgi:hypothetical protein